MKILDYLKDKLLSIIIFIISLLLVLLMLNISKVNEYIVILIIIILILNYIIVNVYDYLKRKSFYNNFKKTLDGLDKKYLITEMIKNDNFSDSKLLLEYLYEIDKSMHEEVNNYKYNVNEFKEYIELWCHEIKTPIATSKLIIDNNSNKTTQSILEEINKIELFVEQVLFYSRSDVVDKDYIIINLYLKEVIDNVIKRNRKDLINKKIKININCNSFVDSDSKWLEFIINQIVTNSIKYSKNKDAYIKIESIENKNNVILNISDNGIGINAEDVNKVFNKGFTGTNGRKYNSTGMGLFLCKKLCDKLEHNISIKSKENIGTTISIIFPKSSLTSDI